MNLPIPTAPVLLAALLSTVAPAAAEWDAPETAPAERVTVIVGSESGALPTDLRADGEGVEVLSVGSPDELAGRWQVVVYVDQRLTGTRALFQVLDALGAEAETWAELGEIELVLVDAEPSTIARGSDPELLEQIFYQQSLESSGEQALRQLRVEFLDALEKDLVDPHDLAAAALERELDLLRRRQDQLVAWIAARGRRAAPRALVLLNEASGVDSIGFYGTWLEDAGEIVRSSTRPIPPEQLAEVLASYGWTVLPIVLPASTVGDERFSLRTNRSIGFRLRLGGDDEEKLEQPDPERLALDAGRFEAMQRLAVATGGTLVADLDDLPEIAPQLARRRPVELALAEPYGPPRRLELVSPGSDEALAAPRWVGGYSEAVAEVRIRRALDGEGDSGELPVRALVHLTAPKDRRGSEIALEPAAETLLEVRVDLSRDTLGAEPIAPRLRLRISVGIHRQDDRLSIQHDLVEADLSDGSTWSFERPIELPPATDAAVVVVHSLETGQRGESFAEFVRRPTASDEELTAPAPLEAERPSGPAVRLLRLPEEARRGKVKLRTETRGDVAEVLFMLDGEHLGVRRRAPFSIKANLGEQPRQRSIIAIAYDDDGHELGRDGLVVNEAETRFWVRITEPPPSDRVGPLDVRTNLRIPEERRLERVDYYWNERRVGATTEAPHEQRVLIPIDAPAGFIRVVATLDDGTTAEDVVLMNTQRFESRITVELVELYVVVTDRQGQPVRGLEPDDFIVREQGEVQEIESFSVAGDLPLTVGLAIDSSLSLFRKLPDVQAAAARFVERLEPARDRAFLVEFGDRPRLVHPVTADLSRINDRIRRLEPSGNTAVWEGISLALEELAETSGRRALVVFYDGDDEDESYSYRKTLDLARSSRLPVYLIVMNDEAARTDGRGFNVRSRVAKLEQLARTGGGRVFYVRTDADLTPIFADIGEELRSHYLLTYYPERALENPEWRPIRVEVAREGLTARTLSGYGSE